MARFFALVFCALLFCGCSDDDTATAYYTPPQDISSRDTTVSPKSVRKNEALIEGLKYNVDSVTLQALLQYNRITIDGLCESIISDLIQKDKKVALKDQIQTLYAFELSKEDIDSLKYYGFRENDISHSESTKPIYITGASPYKEKGLWEKVKINVKNYEQNYPVLYKKAIALFLATKKPSLSGVTVTDQASKYTDYSAEYQYADEQSVYVYFTVKNVNQNIEISLNKSEN